MVNEKDASVLSYVRRAPDGKAVLVALNCTSAPRKASYDVGHGQATTLISTFAKPGQAVDLKNVELPPYGVFVGQVE